MSDDAYPRDWPHIKHGPAYFTENSFHDCDEDRPCQENLDELNHKFALEIGEYPPHLHDDKWTRDRVANEVLRDFYAAYERAWWEKYPRVVDIIFLSTCAWILYMVFSGGRQ